MARTPESVEWVDWGTFSIFGQTHARTPQGKTGMGKDIRVIEHEVSEWQERKGHSLNPSMLAAIYDHGIDTLVIGVGVYGAIECPESVIQELRDHGIADVRLERTPQACRTFTSLLGEGKHVALLAHGTC